MQDNAREDRAEYGGGLPGTVPGVPVQDEGSAPGEESRQSREQGERLVERRSVRGVLHDEVEAARGRFEPGQHVLDRCAQELGPGHAVEAKVSLRHLEDDRVALDHRYRARTDPRMEQMELRASARADEERCRAACEI